MGLDKLDEVPFSKRHLGALIVEEAQDPIKQPVTYVLTVTSLKVLPQKIFEGGIPLPWRLCRWLGTGLSSTGLEGHSYPQWANGLHAKQTPALQVRGPRNLELDNVGRVQISRVGF